MFFKYEEPIPLLDNTIRSFFYDTPKLPTHMISLSVFNKNDFKSVSRQALSGKKVCLNLVSILLSILSLNVCNSFKCIRYQHQKTHLKDKGFIY